MNSQPLLDELLDLLNTVNRINRNLVQRECRNSLISLSAIQMQAVIAIRRHEVLNMSDLADHLLVTRPQLTKVIGTLEELGLIVRTINPESRREVLIALTEQGKRFVADSLLSKSSFLAKVLAASSEEEMEELRQAVATIHRIFSKVLDE